MDGDEEVRKKSCNGKLLLQNLLNYGLMLVGHGKPGVAKTASKEETFKLYTCPANELIHCCFFQKQQICLSRAQQISSHFPPLACYPKLHTLLRCIYNWPYN